ncbi:MAG: DUF3846 domain-containing protein [Rhodococcus sp. (in: high G+C Gram-positive bacteria)]|uniref:DUF3846 domain-containing protein n=1 Tax=Rhodococcus sp. TaxID=1831 RepID=UPI003BAE4BF3
MDQALRVGTNGAVEEIDLGTEATSRIREVIDCQMLEVVRLTPDLDMWVDEEGLYAAQPEVNRTATAIAWAHGFVWQRYLGVAVFTSHDQHGAVTALTDLQMSALMAAATELNELITTGGS